MKNHHRITKSEGELLSTLDLKKLLRLKVISNKGLVIGKVSQIRIHQAKMHIEGILVSRGFFKKPIYIGSSYISKFSHASFLLNVEPSVLLKGKTVINSQGEKIGKVKEIIRKEHSNQIEKLIIRSFLKKDFELKISNIKSIGNSVIINPNHHVEKKYFWKKS